MNFNLKEEILKKQLTPNYLGGGIYLNPNSNKDVKSTDKLNKVSATLRESTFFKKYVSSEGFELSFADFNWEWIINFNNKSGFIVFREYGPHLRMFVYKHNDDLNWDEIIINNFSCNTSSISKLENLIKQQYRSKIQ
jgi:hypothetical protein